MRVKNLLLCSYLLLLIMHSIWIIQNKSRTQLLFFFQDYVLYPDSFPRPTTYVAVLIDIKKIFYYLINYMVSRCWICTAVFFNVFIIPYIIGSHYYITCLKRQPITLVTTTNYSGYNNWLQQPITLPVKTQYI